MPKTTKTKKIPLRDPINEREAVQYLLFGIGFFLRKHTFKTLLFFALIFGAPGYVVVDYYTSSRTKIEEAKPISSEFSIMPQVYAGGDEPIILNGKTWGYKSQQYDAWVLNWGGAILVYDKESKADPIIVRISGGEENLQMKKK